MHPNSTARAEQLEALHPNYAALAGCAPRPYHLRIDDGGLGRDLNDRIDSREAWHITVAALDHCLGSAWRPLHRDRCAEIGGRRSRRLSLDPLGGGLARHARHRHRRPRHGLARRAGGRQIRRHLRRPHGGRRTLALSSGGEVWQLYVGHGLLIGLLGNAAIHAPLYVYVTRWFERRRGTALALIASGQYMAGACWPPLFERAIAAYGWRATMVGFGLIVAALVVPLAVLFLRPPPEARRSQGSAQSRASEPAKCSSCAPNTAFAVLAVAAFLCCVPMSMPSSHLIALCGDLGVAPTRGAVMLTVLLACAFVSRQLWGWISDRIGGLTTLLVGSLAPGGGHDGLHRHPGRSGPARRRRGLRARLQPA